MELGTQQGPPVFLNAMSCSRSPQCWFFGALRHSRKFPGISAHGSSAALQGCSMSGVLSLDNGVGPKCSHISLLWPCTCLWRAHNGSQTSTQMVFSHVALAVSLSRGEVVEGCVGRLSWVNLTAFGVERSEPRRAIVVPAVILLS